jgi:hypothetical protein
MDGCRGARAEPHGPMRPERSRARKDAAKPTLGGEDRFERMGWGNSGTSPLTSDENGLDRCSKIVTVKRQAGAEYVVCVQPVIDWAVPLGIWGIWGRRLRPFSRMGQPQMTRYDSVLFACLRQ